MAVIGVVAAGCNRAHRPEGARLAGTYCAVCHAFPEPALLDKATWKSGVLPQMATRVGVHSQAAFEELLRHPQMRVLTKPPSQQDWDKIVAYYLAAAPDSLPAQSLPAEPSVEPVLFKPQPFAPGLQSSAIITLLKPDSIHKRILVGEAGTNTLRVFDRNRHLVTTLSLESPPTGAIVDSNRVLLLESGILSPNDEPRGRLAEYDLAPTGSMRLDRVLIDSLLRPVFVARVDFDLDGRADYLICEFGDNRGRLALYHDTGGSFARQVLAPDPGAIRAEIVDMTGDGHPDIVALLAQGDERIVLFENDGKGNFSAAPRVLARFPPVYGSMDFSLHDFNGDGNLDIIYVNGDNFDYSRIFKPYHGVRILENDGHNSFTERYFFPIYGAAQAAVADFDQDHDLDLVIASNFADVKRHPERGIMFLENTGHYRFQPYAFSIAAGNQWNVMTTADVNGDGKLDVLVGAMDLQNIANMQRRTEGQTRMRSILFFENRASQVRRQP